MLFKENVGFINTPELRYCYSHRYFVPSRSLILRISTMCTLLTNVWSNASI